MKATVAVAALAAGVSANGIHHRHAHPDSYARLERNSYDNSTCGCTTMYSTWTGEATLYMPPPSSSSSVAAVSSSSAPAPTTLTATEVIVPTPATQTISTTGVYTFPATTITLTDSTTVAAASPTAVTSGTNTVGGVTTVVTASTTVICPYATVSTSGSVTTSVIETTTTICPSAGTYTIAPTTTVVPEATTVTVPVVTSYPAGTYTQPEVVTTIYETSTTVICPFDIPATTTTSHELATTTVHVSSASTSVVTTTVTSATSPVAPVVTSPVTSVATSPAEVATSPAEVATSPATSVATSAPASTSSSSSGSSSGSVPAVGPAGKAWAISYTPYGTSEAAGCKTQDQINADIAAIAAAGIAAVRVYSTDCSTLPWVGAACEANGVKMILGVYIDEVGCDAASPSVSEQVAAIKSWAKWDLVDAILVGNEAVADGYCTAAELASVISECKSAFSGYSGPISTAETVNIWQEDDFVGAVCGVVDFVGANAHAFFNTETTAPEAGEFVQSQLDIIDRVCPGKEGRICETGWPAEGVAMGKAVPGVAQQKQAIDSILETCGDRAVLFSLTSDAWKSDATACQCEQHWGCASVLGISLT
ncbi:glycoside hydrolase family 17 protein [Xylariaceae sp. FL0804]|nr:glycoside hydrolase family 17 protein [Xylariaceae sp. FL0804]